MRTLKVKLLSFLLVVMLLVAMVPFGALAATPTVVNGWDDFKVQVADGGEITLNGTVTFFETVYITKDTVINLNGNLINIDNSYFANELGAEIENLFVVSGATLTIKGTEENQGVVDYNGTKSPFKLVGVEDKQTKLVLNKGSYQARSRYDVTTNDFVYPEAIVEIEAAANTVVPTLEINGGYYSTMLNANSSEGKLVEGNDANVSIIAGNFGTDLTKYTVDGSVAVNYEYGGCVIYDIADEPSAAIKKLLDEKGELVVKRFAPETEKDIYLVSDSLYFYFYDVLEDESVWLIPQTYNKEESYLYAEVSNKENGNFLYAFKLPLVFEYDKAIKPQIEKIIESLPKGEESPEGGEAYEYSVNDLELINYWLTCTEDDENINALINYSDEFKRYIGYKNFLIDARYGDGGYFFTFAGGIADFKYNGTVYGTTDIAVRAQHILYVPDNTENTTEALLKAAQDRIDGYLGKDKVALSYKDTLLEMLLKSTYENTRYEWEQQLGANATYEDWKQSAFCPTIDVERDTEIEGVTDNTPVFTTTINGVEYHLLVMRDSSKMVTPKYQNIDMQSNVTVLTDNASVPLDTMLEVEKLTSGEEYDRIMGVLKPEESTTFDIKLHSGSADKYVTKLSSGEFELRIPIPDDFVGKDLQVCYVDEDNKIETFQPTVIEEDAGKYAVINTNHFSIYTLTATEPFTETESADTSDNTNLTLWATLCVFSGALLLAAVYGKKRFEI